MTTAVLPGGLGDKLKISATTDLTEEVRCEQSLSDGDAWRLDDAVAIVATITSIFSRKVSDVIRDANEPVDGLESTDTIASVALVAKF